ncbi:MAG TPA: hypothetical protein PKN45_07900 [Candidatus Limiplasma sp.]|nr:hypothetical protein [Candidatus Limiplasma sp.]
MMAKDPFSSKIRLTLLKGMEAIGTSASNLASNAKLKASEINLENRRREILTNFSLRAFEMWQKGVSLPEPLNEMLVELCDIDDRLSVLRAQKYARVATPDAPSQDDHATPDASAEGEDSCAVGDTETGEETPVPCDVQPVEPDSSVADAEPKPEPNTEENE